MHSHVQFAMRFPRQDLARSRPLKESSLPRWGNYRVDIPRLRAAGFDCLVVSLYAMEFPLWTAGQHYRHLLDELHAAQRLAGEYPEDFTIVHNIPELAAARREGRIALILAAEGAHAVGRDLNRLERLHGMGLRSLQLAHWIDTPALRVNRVRRRDGSPLTPFGRELLGRLRELGMIVDVAHISRRTFRDVLEHFAGPIINSHAACRSLCDVQRNFDDEELRLLAATGGVLGMSYFPPYLTEGARRVPLARMVEHIVHATDVAGPEHVGLGSDYNGAPFFVDGLGDLRGHAELAEALLARGLGRQAVSGIFGGNFLRVVEKVWGR